MLILNKKVNIEEFFNSLQNSKKSLLILDYDGTLAPFHIDPKKALPYSGVIDALQRLINETNTKVIIVTGRAIQDLLPLLNLEKLPEIWGSHGGESLIQGKYHIHTLSNDQKEGLDIGWAASTQSLPVIRIERKPLSIAAHWRGMDAQEITSIKNKIFEDWKP